VNITRTVARLLLFRGHRCHLRFEVRRVEENYEEEEVAQVHQEAVSHVRERLLTVLTARLRGVRGHVDDQPHEHLPDLYARHKYVDPARDLYAQRAHRVVGVHERVHGVVHDHEPPAGRSVVGVTVPDVRHHLIMTG